MFKFCLLLILALFNVMAHGQLKVVTTIPDLAEVVKSIGGQKVSVTSLLDGTEDPHFLDATPSFIRRVANADIVCIVGLDLEVGWIPKVLQKSGNAKVQPGGEGYCVTGSKVKTLDSPTHKVDRSMGDVHASGNPHFNLSPSSLIQAGASVLDHLIKLDPANTVSYKKGYDVFKNQMLSLKKEISLKLEKATSLSESKNIIVEYHKEFTYFFKEYSLQSNFSIEKLPGVPPSARRIADVALQAKKEGLFLAIGSHYAPVKHLKKFSEISGVKFKKVPTMVQKNKKQFDSISKVQHYIANSISESLSL